jgi:hypothetical protein
VVWMSGNWIGRGLRSSIGDFSGVGRGYQAQDARYWLECAILMGRSMRCLLHSRIVCEVRTRGKRNLGAESVRYHMVGTVDGRVTRTIWSIGWGT